MNFIDRNIMISTGIGLVSGITLVYIITKSISMIDVANGTLRLFDMIKSIPEKVSFELNENINYFELKFNRRGKKYNILLHKDEFTVDGNTYEVEFDNEKKTIILPNKMPLNVDINKLNAKCITKISKDGTRVIIQENIDHIDFYDE